MSPAASRAAVLSQSCPQQVVTPVLDPRLKARLQEILDVNLADDTLAWALGADATWQKVGDGAGTHNTHLRLAQMAASRGSESHLPPAARPL